MKQRPPGPYRLFLNPFITFFFQLRDTLVDSRKGIHDVAVSMIPQVVGVITGFSGSVLIARGLGPKGLGQYALVISLAGVAAGLSDLGIGQTAIRFAARAAAQSDTETQMAVLRWAFRLRLALVAVVTGAFLLIAPSVAEHLWHAPDLTGLMQLGLLGGILAALSAIPNVYFQSVKQFDVNAAVGSAQRLLSFLGILVLALLKRWSILLVLAVTLVTSAITSLGCLRLVPKTALWPPKGIRSISNFEWLRFFHSPRVGEDTGNQFDRDTPSTFAFYQLVSTIIVTLILQADIWLMGVLLDKADIGVYSAATRFTLPLTTILGALNTALWPRASATTSRNDISSLMKKTFATCGIVSVAGLVYSVLVPLLTPLLFGLDYGRGTLLAQVLCLRYCIAILVCPIGLISYSLGSVRFFWWINAIQLVGVICLNLLLVPRIGALGSAIALVVNEILGIALAGIMIARRLRPIEVDSR